jgi:hypothetical protein
MILLGFEKSTLNLAIGFQPLVISVKNKKLCAFLIFVVQLLCFDFGHWKLDFGLTVAFTNSSL